MNQWNKIREKIQIKSKKDRLIAFCFSALIIYVLSVQLFGWDIKRFMQRLMPGRMTQMNQPDGYGTVAFVALTLAVLVMAVMALERRKKKYIAFVGIVGITVFAGALAGFAIHCHLIEGRGWKEDAASVWISSGNMSINLRDGDERLRHLQELAFSMEKITGEETEALEETARFGEGDRGFVWFRFPDKYFHGYDAIFDIKDGAVYVRNGDRKMTFFRDNGFTDYVRRLMEETEK